MKEEIQAGGAAILVVEDDAHVAESLKRGLGEAGFAVATADRLAAADARLAQGTPALVVLDLNLPDGDGRTWLRRVRGAGHRMPVIILTARDTLPERVAGLEEGADDYLPKPFHTAELLARIKSVTRRSNGSGRNGIVYGNVKLNPDSRTVEVCGKALTLVKKEYDILHYFLLRPGHMVDKSVLAEAVWGDDIYLADNFDFIYSQVKNLRKKLEEAGADIEIKSVYGFGYKLVTKE